MQQFCVPFFEIKEEVCGRVGLVNFTGEITPRLLRCIEDLEMILPSLAGLFVCWDSPGGLTAFAERIELFILRATQKMPVVSFILRCQSAALIPACVANLVFSDGGGLLGSFGFGAFLCDGEQPQYVVCEQSPGKWTAEGPGYSPRAFWRGGEEDRLALIGSLNNQYERGLALLSLYRRVPAERLRAILDGGDFLARTALKRGLIDAIMTEEEAYQSFLNLVGNGHKQGGKR